ncbi:UDP-4-amino-4,6-dideoxy-N-acetyl-beta-L-altrosamine N-acetyltransferase [Lysinibacillus sp. NPDC058147]|uniref:UDP-4-amino-4, 6-dideoxy-N-acetyl-beta-L-altrosamine N-acetyltransferase n=1 Tax=unclassified Lysinibacillus TaxID=2636778 RepID=UPI0036D8663C
MIWRKVQKKHLQKILDWRTKENITRVMYTDIPYSMENQKKWFEAINECQTSMYWVMEYNGESIGLISLTSINWHNKRAYWNFYVGEEKYALLAGFIGLYMYNYAFKELGLKKLLGEVMDINEGVQKLHLRQGAREVGILEKHIFKNNVWHDVHLFEMTAERWSINERYSKYIVEVE